MAAKPIPEFEIRHRMALALERADISVVEIARELRISRTTVSNYLHGRTKPDHATLFTWAAKCHVPLDWLETGMASSAADPSTSDAARAELRRVLAERYEGAVAAIADPDLVDQ